MCRVGSQPVFPNKCHKHFAHRFASVLDPPFPNFTAQSLIKGIAVLFRSTQTMLSLLGLYLEAVPERRLWQTIIQTPQKHTEHLPCLYDQRMCFFLRYLINRSEARTEMMRLSWHLWSCHCAEI